MLACVTSVRRAAPSYLLAGSGLGAGSMCLSGGVGVAFDAWEPSLRRTAASLWSSQPHHSAVMCMGIHHNTVRHRSSPAPDACVRHSSRPIEACVPAHAGLKFPIQSKTGTVVRQLVRLCTRAGVSDFGLRVYRSRSLSRVHTIRPSKSSTSGAARRPPPAARRASRHSAGPPVAIQPARLVGLRLRSLSPQRAAGSGLRAPLHASERHPHRPERRTGHRTARSASRRTAHLIRLRMRSHAVGDGRRRPPRFRRIGACVQCEPAARHTC